MARYTVVYGENGDDDIAANGEGGQIADGGQGDDIVRADGFFGNSWGYGSGGSDTITFSVAARGVGFLDGGDGPDTILAHASGEPSTALPSTLRQEQRLRRLVRYRREVRRHG